MKLLTLAITLIALLVVGLFVAPLFVNWNQYKPEIINGIKQATGYTVELNGDISLSIFPMPKASIEGLVVKAPQSKDFENILEMDKAQVGINLPALLNSEIKISQVTLKKPIIRLEILENGQESWVVGNLLLANVDSQKEVPQTSVDNEQAPNTIEPEAGNVSQSNEQSNEFALSLDKFQIRDGSVIFINHKTGETYDLQKINADLKAENLEGPYEGKGDLVYDQKEIKFSLQTKQAEGENSIPLTAEIELPQVGSVIAFDGVTSKSAPFDAQGKIDFKTKSLQKLVSLSGNENASIPDQNMSLVSFVSLDENKVQMDELEIGFGDLIAKGNANIENLKTRNPLVMKINLNSQGAFNIQADVKQTAQNDISIQTKGAVQNIAKFLDEVAPQVDAKAITDQYQSADFDVVAALTGETLNVSKGNVKLDDTVIEFKGSQAGKKITIDSLNIPNYVGASIQAQGVVADAENLSGIDLKTTVKTQDISALAQKANIDISKLPQELKSFNAEIETKGSANALNFSSNIAAMNGTLQAVGLIKNAQSNPQFEDLGVGLKHPNLLSALKILQPEFEGAQGLNQPVDFFSKINMNNNVYDLTDMRLSLGPTSITGALTIDTSNPIIGVKGTIKGKKIALDSLLGAQKTASIDQAIETVNIVSSGWLISKAYAQGASGKWSNDPFNLRWMDTLNVDLDVAAEQLTYANWNFVNPATKVKIEKGKATISDLTAGVFGGNAKLSATVTNSPTALDLKTTMTNISLESLAGALSGSSRLKASGNVSFTADIRGAGSSANALIQTLNGSAALNGNDVILKGFDLAKLAQGLQVDQKLATSFENFRDGALSSGQTNFDTIEGTYTISKGIVNIDSMIMDGPSSIIDSRGQADLPQWFINVDNFITLKNVPDLKPIEVKIKGPIDNPSDTFGKNILEDYVQQKLRRKIEKELPGILGDDVTNKLQEFGIIQRQQPAPTPTPQPQDVIPANDNEVQNLAPQQQEEAPKKIEKPEDAINELLNNENPEDAVNNIIRGLF